MCKDNAYKFLDNFVYRNKIREDRLKQTSDDDELIQLVVQMAKDDKWPTGDFDNLNVKEAIEEKTRIEYPPVYNTLTRLFREGRIGSAALFW
jgi:hypothetical protein